MKASEAKKIADQEPARRLDRLLHMFLFRIRDAAHYGEYKLDIDYELKDEDFIKEKVAPLLEEQGYSLKFIDGQFEVFGPLTVDNTGTISKLPPKELKKKVTLSWDHANE